MSHFLPVPALPQGRKHIQGLCPLRRVIKDSCFANIVDKVLLELKLLVFKVEKGMSFPQVDRSIFSSPVSLSHGDTLSQQRRGPLVRGGPGRRACERPGGPAHWSSDSRAPLPQVGGTRPLLGRLRGSLLCLALHLVAQVTSQMAAEAAGYQSGNKQGNTQRGRQVPPPTLPRAFSSSSLNLPPRGADGSGPPPALAGSSPVAGEEEEEREDVGL